MRISALFREATRNIITGTTRFTLFSFALSLLFYGIIYADASAIKQQIDAANSFRSSGGTTLTLAAQGQIDGSACESLAGVPGVSAAGALRNPSQKISLSSLPNAPIPEFTVTPGFPRLFSPTGTGNSGLILPQEIAESLGVTEGDTIATSSGDARIGATYLYPSDGRRPGFGYAVLSVTNDQEMFDECWVQAWPQITNLRALLFTAIKPESADSSQPPTLSQLNSALGYEYSGNTFHSRITRNAPLLACLLSLVLGYLSVRSRRLQLASALHSGVSRPDLLFLLMIETMTWAIPSVILGISVAVAVTHTLPTGDNSSLFNTEIGVPLAGFFGVAMGALYATITTRERHLFRYFKDR